MHPVEFEPAIPASDRPQTLALRMWACYLAYELAKPKPKTANLEDNAKRRLGLDMSCNAIAAAASAVRDLQLNNLVSFYTNHPVHTQSE